MIDFHSSFWFFDIDDTLIDTAGVTEKAAYGIFEALVQEYGVDLSQKISSRFTEIFHTLLAGYQLGNNPEIENREGIIQRSQKLLKRIESCQKQIVQEFGTYKKWSREVLIKLAMEDNEIEPRNNLIQKAANGYWELLTSEVPVFEGAIDFLNFLIKEDRPVILITSSDARLQMKNDGQFMYDCKYSEEMKRERIEKMKSRGIIYDGLVIGDPEDKPSIDFFKKGLNFAYKLAGKQIKTSNCIIVGDSFQGDLKTPLTKLDFGLAILFKKGQGAFKKEGEGYYSVGNLMDIATILDVPKN